MSESQTTELKYREVEYMPDKIEPGILYHSPVFKTAIHLCACGCGNKTVTPIRGQNQFHPSQFWGLTGFPDKPTLHGSIGNQNVCGSHYNITEGKIQWL
jgi:hypothetical protein